MSDQNRFFRFVWRVNAIVALLVGLSILAVIAFAVVSSYVMRDAWKDAPPVSYFAPVPKGAEQKYTYRIEARYYGVDSVSLQNGSATEEVFPLRRWHGKPADYGVEENPYGFQHVVTNRVPGPSEPAVLTVNLLSVDAKSGASHWLFTGYSRSIEAIDSVSDVAPTGSKADQTAPVIAAIITTYDADSNKDGKYTAADQPSLYVYRAGDAKATKLLSMDAIITKRQAGETYLVLYEKGKGAYAATFSIPAFKLLAQVPLPNVPK